jgi:hypothetical protein
VNEHSRPTNNAEVGKEDRGIGKIRSKATKFSKLHNSISCRYFGIRTLVVHSQIESVRDFRVLIGWIFSAEVPLLISFGLHNCFVQSRKSVDSGGFVTISSPSASSEPSHPIIPRGAHRCISRQWSMCHGPSFRNRLFPRAIFAHARSPPARATTRLHAVAARRNVSQHLDAAGQSLRPAVVFRTKPYRPPNHSRRRGKSRPSRGRPSRGRPTPARAR